MLLAVIVASVPLVTPGLARAAGPVPAPAHQPDGPSSGFVARKGGKLSTHLDRLATAVDASASGLAAAAYVGNPVAQSVGPAVAGGLIRVDEYGRVQVYVHLTEVGQASLDALTSLGAVIERVAESGTPVQARVPISKLSSLAALEIVAVVTEPSYGAASVGSRLTQGDALMNLNDLRARLGVDGTGVTVGVISDGIFGLQDAIALGDLPASGESRSGGTLIATSGGVIAQSFRADGDLEGGLGVAVTGAEGTAMLEIIHDIAPGAQLRFANFQTDLDFIAAVEFLASVSDVMVDDIGFFGLPANQTSPISLNAAEELNRATNPIRGYYNAVGNGAQAHYRDTFDGSGGNCRAFLNGSTCHLFDPGDAGVTNAFPSTLPGPQTVNPISVANGATAIVFLTWDETSGGATSDYDLYIYVNGSASPTPVAVGGANNPVTGEPSEFAVITGTGVFYDIVVVNFLGAQPAVEFDLFVIGAGGLPNGTQMTFNTVAGSLTANSDAGGGVVSAGAIDVSDVGFDTIESFSARGPTLNGATKPDVTSADGVQVTGSGGFGSTFFGTSAASPHLGGLAALLLDLRPSLLSGEPGDDPAADRAALRNAIVTGVFDLGTPGTDNTFGAGRSDGVLAATVLMPEPGEPVNVAAVAGPASATVSWSSPLWDGADPITRYIVTSTPHGVTVAVDGSTFSTAVTGLAVGTEYTFVVAAVSASGVGATSPPSSPVTALAVATPVPVPSASAWALIGMAVALAAVGTAGRRLLPSRRGPA